MKIEEIIIEARSTSTSKWLMGMTSGGVYAAVFKFTMRGTTPVVVILRVAGPQP